MTFAATLRYEIDHRTMKLIVGVIALAMAPLTGLLAWGITSVSAAYWDAGPAHVVFIGFLFAFASFFLAYNGYWLGEMILSKVAAVAAVLIAWFPCECGHPNQGNDLVHNTAAATMFLILALFCFFFYLRAKRKAYTQAKIRAVIYIICGVVIIVAIILTVVNAALGGIFGRYFVFWAEAAALTAFGVAWLLASRVLPFICAPGERFSPFAANNPPS